MHKYLLRMTSESENAFLNEAYLQLPLEATSINDNT